MKMKFYQKWWHYYIGWRTGKEKACGKKIDYKSFKSSHKAAVKLSEKWETNLEPYPCIWCKGWHIGHGKTINKDNI